MEAFQAVLNFLAENRVILFLIAIPFINGLIGWITNIIAIKMTFYPLEFVGIWKPYIGWQGIIPMKARKMAEMSVDIMTRDLVRIKDQFEKIDPDALANEMRLDVMTNSRKIIDEAMMIEAPVIWRTIPAPAKELLFREANKELPMVIKYLMEDLKEVIEEVLDLKTMTVEVLENNKMLLNRTFYEVGDKEFDFIEKSGFYFGFLFGLIQAAVWYITTARGHDYWYILPIGGFIVGFMTNYLAITLIFNPKKPINIFGFKLQGMYIKRQKEISASYAQIVSEEVVTTGNMFRTIFEGDKRDKVMNIGEKHVRKAVDKGKEFFEQYGILRVIVNYLSSESRVRQANNIREYIVTHFVDTLPETFTRSFPFITRQLGLKETIRTKMSALPPDEFANFLRPVFKEDEWKLILVGGVLGFIAGLLQLGMVNL